MLNAGPRVLVAIVSRLVRQSQRFTSMFVPSATHFLLVSSDLLILPGRLTGSSDAGRKLGPTPNVSFAETTDGLVTIGNP